MLNCAEQIPLSAMFFIGALANKDPKISFVYYRDGNSEFNTTLQSIRILVQLILFFFY